MSYCRFGPESDVYVYENHLGGYVCYDKHDRHENFGCSSAKGMANHLREHQRRGHKVPRHAIDALESEEESVNPTCQWKC